MAKKRRQEPRLDPARALNAEYEQRIKRKQELKREKEMEALHDAEVNAAWEKAKRDFDLEGFQNLGEVLSRWKYTIWIDFLRVQFPRNLHLRELAGQNPHKILAEENPRILALRLLIAACGDRHLKIQSELDHISQMEFSNHILAAVREALWQWSFEDLEEFHRYPHRATPWIIPADFYRAMGTSRKVMEKRIENGEISINDVRQLHGKSKLHRYYHPDPTTNDVMLKSVIDFLKRQKKFSPSKPWYETLWDPIEAE